jgi:hypothetical protein
MGKKVVAARPASSVKPPPAAQAAPQDAGFVRRVRNMIWSPVAQREGVATGTGGAKRRATIDRYVDGAM